VKRIFLPLLFLFARVNDAYSCTTDCTRNSLDIVANCHAACNGTTDDTDAINCALDAVGGLPEDRRHAAQVVALAMRAAARDALDRQGKG